MIKLIPLLALISVAAPGADGFHDESEVGAAIVSGNTNSESYNLKQSNVYGWNDNTVKIYGRFLNSRSTSGTGPNQVGLTDTARSWNATLRYERSLSEVFSLFTSYGLDSDIFSGYVQRNNFDLGAKYFITKNEDTIWTTEVGYRNIVTHYPASEPDTNSSNVRLYSEISQNLMKTTTLKLYVEYIQALYTDPSGPGYSVQQDYQLNTEPSITVMISQIFSLKVAYLFKYMNYIPTNSTATNYLDTIFTTALVAKF